MSEKLLYIKIIITIFLCTFLFSNLHGQEKERRIIELHGNVLNDSAQAVPFAHVYIKNRRGTITDFWGNYYLLAEVGDTVIFSSVGYKKRKFYVSDSLTASSYIVNIKMKFDIIMLSPAIVRPWQTYEQFKEAVVNLRLPDDDYTRAMRNIRLIVAQSKIDPYQMDARNNYRYYMRQHADKIYYAGQMQPQNLFNVVAWANFFKALKEGRLKSKD